MGRTVHRAARITALSISGCSSNSAFISPKRGIDHGTRIVPRTSPGSENNSKVNQRRFEDLRQTANSQAGTNLRGSLFEWQHNRTLKSDLKIATSESRMFRFPVPLLRALGPRPEPAVLYVRLVAAPQILMYKDRFVSTSFNDEHHFVIVIRC